MDVAKVAITDKVNGLTDVEGFGLSEDLMGFEGDSFGEERRVHNDFYNSIGGRISFAEAPQEIETPYCVFHFINEAYEFYFHEEFERILVQFNIYSSDYSPVEYGRILSDLKALFDWTDLTIEGYTHKKMERNFVRTDRFDEDKLWQCIVQYTWLMQKNT